MMAANRNTGPLTRGLSSDRPLLIVGALLLASFVVGLDTRVFAIGLTELRAPFSLGGDEAAWLSTIANAPQILISAAVAWLATAFGIRRVMIPTAIVYAAVSLLIPLVHNPQTLFALHVLRALLLGVFIPATIMAIFRNLDPRYWVVGIAIYTLRVPLSQYLGVVLVGFYGNFLGWQWLYWQDVLLAPLIAILLILGAPKEEINFSLVEHADWGGMLLLGSAMTMLYIALDQGNRLDWFESGLITALLVAGIALAAAFFVNECLVEHPWAHASAILSRNIGIGYAIIIAFAFSSAGASIAIPGFVQNVTGLRPIALSEPYLLGAVLPILASIALATRMLRRIDARICIVAGLAAMAIGSLIASRLNADWSAWTFLPAIALQGVGQTFAFFATVLYLIANLDPKRSTAVSAYIQVIRLVGVEMAGSVMTTWLRYREQFHSNILGTQIAWSSSKFGAHFSKVISTLGPFPHAQAETFSYFGKSLRTQANVLAYSDDLLISFWFAVLGIVLVALLGGAPLSPLHPKFAHGTRDTL